MKLGYVMTTERGATDRLLTGIAALCGDRGYRLAGIVQTNTASAVSHLCDMDVKVLPDGPVHRISQSLGAQSRGCRLDPSALEAAVADVVQSLTPLPDLLIVNKFGKHEADGRGFRDIIGQCLAEDVPVLVGVNALNREAFINFTDGMAEEIAADEPAVLQWVEEALTATGRAA